MIKVTSATVVKMAQEHGKREAVFSIFERIISLPGFDIQKLHNCSSLVGPLFVEIDTHISQLYGQGGGVTHVEVFDVTHNSDFFEAELQDIEQEVQEEMGRVNEIVRRVWVSRVCLAQEM